MLLQDRRPRRRPGLPPRLRAQRLRLHRPERPARKAEGKATQVVRYTVDRRPPHRIDPASKQLIIEWASNGHDGGDLAFGNDGFLYVSSGDGSSGSDANVTGQTLDDLLAAVLRIDVDHPDPGRNYGVPRDNPFVDRPGARPELWAYGLRNPWRLSFDRESGQLWVGQNGQDLWEQVYLIKKGGNYGWSLSEGSHVFHAERKAGPDPILPPTAEHHHSEARSLTGGRVYRGTRLPDLVGAYVYGDWSTGRVWGVKHDGTEGHSGIASWSTRRSTSPGFGTDHAGELYVIDQGGGFYRFEPTTEADQPAQPFPTRLSETGLFASVADHKPHPAALPFEVCRSAVGRRGDHGAVRRTAGPGADRAKAPAQRGRSVDLPQRLGPGADAQSRTWPTTAGKPARKRIETRLLVRQQGEWGGLFLPLERRRRPTPSWSLLPASAAELDVADPSDPSGRREQTWRFPARSECLVCHSRAAGFVLGFTPLQLDRDRDYGGVHRQPAPHARTYRPLSRRRCPDEARARPPAPGQPLRHPGAARGPGQVVPARQLLDLPRQGGGRQRSAWSWGSTRPPGRMRLIDEVPMHDRFGIDDARLVAPGSPERSVLYSPDLAPGDRPDAAPGVHRGRPQGRRADRRLDSRPAPRRSLTSCRPRHCR